MFETQPTRVAPDLNGGTRLVWASADAQTTWEPRVVEAIRAWQELEMLSVAASLRSCALISVSRGTPSAVVQSCLGGNLIAVPVATDDFTSQPCVSTSPRLAIEDRSTPQLVLGDAHSVRQFQKAHDRKDYETLGSLLGIPSCCVEFFHEFMIEGGSLDSTWAIAERSSHQASPDGLELTVKGWRETNILWRPAGVRAVPHLPCSFDCAESAAFGRRLLDLGRVNGLRRGVDFIEQILALPVEWSALDGTADIRTPIAQIATRTDSSAERHVVRRIGPRTNSQGDATCFREVSQPQENGPTRKVGVSRSEREYAAQNGFFTVEGMEVAHRPIVQYVHDLLDTRGHATVLDLGCGNGALLRAICQTRAQVTPVGVEIDVECAQDAGRYVGELGGTIILGDMLEHSAFWDSPIQYDVVLLMVCGLLEVSDEQATLLLRHISKCARHLVVYAYDDEFIRHQGTLGDLARRSGLRLSNWDGYSSVCEAQIAEDRLVRQAASAVPDR